MRKSKQSPSIDAQEKQKPPLTIIQRVIIGSIATFKIYYEILMAYLEHRFSWHLLVFYSH